MPVPLNTRVWGEGGDRRLLLIHGITSSLAGWWRVAPDIAALGWEVTGVDLRGHGDSPRADSYLFSEHVDDLLALGTEWDAVVGHSMGGTISVLTATADRTWTSGMVLADPVLVFPEPMDDVLEWLLSEYRAGTDRERISTASPRWRAEDVTAKIEALNRSDASMVQATVEVNWPWSVLDEAMTLQTPTVVIGSDHRSGGILPVTFGEWLATSPWVEFTMLVGSSHSAHRDDDQYETYRSTLVDALGRLPTLHP